MNEVKLSGAIKSRAADWCLPFLLLLFVGSGCAALIYEIVWFQLLELVIGSSAVSLAVLLGTFMGGMCLGSLALPRLVSARWHPLVVYAALELGIGIIGNLILQGMPVVDRVYSANASGWMSGILGRGMVCAASLLLPTLLMGATLPAIARWVETTPRGVSWLGFFYGGNIAGAVFGCLLAGFYLLRVHDMTTATHVAAGINGAVALLSFGLAMLTPRSGVSGAAELPPNDAEAETERDDPSLARIEIWTVYLTIALSGASALAAEVIWTRLLSLLLGATVYTFSIILAVFLIGLGIGSSAGSFLARTSPRPRVLLGVCQLLLVGAIAWTAYQVAESLPFWPIVPSYAKSPWHLFQLDLARCLWAVLPAACLWGASFPLALSAAAKPGQDPGRLVGGVYAANTVGAIAGAVCASLILIPQLGTANAESVLIGVAAGSALIVLLPSAWRIGEAGQNAPRLAGVLGLVALAAGSASELILHVPQVPWQLIAFGRALPEADEYWQFKYLGEGMNSSVAVTERTGNILSFHVSGKVEASTDPRDMRVQRMLGHLPALLHPQPRSALVVGCGAGVTAGCFVVHPETESVVICEIEPLVPRAIAPYFTKENHDVVHDPRVEIVFDDARHYVLTTPRKFDIITSDPIHPWVKGSATLYTKEYFEMCKRRLNPGGLVTQWVPLYESDLEVVKSEIATFFEVFPNGTIWANQQDGGGYDVVLLGQEEPLTIDADAVQKRLEQPDYAAVRKSLAEVNCQSVVSLLGSYSGQSRDLQSWLTDAAINRDSNLRLQYLAGMNLNRKDAGRIYLDMLRYLRYPTELFVGSGIHDIGVRAAVERSIAAYQNGGQ